MKTTFSIALALVALSLLPTGGVLRAQADIRFEGTDTVGVYREVMAVKDAFSEALIKKDTATLKSLFFSEMSWVLALHNKSLELAQKNNPGMTSNVMVQDPMASMFRNPYMKDVAISESFRHPRLVTDGVIANLWFNYTFEMNKAPSNWGTESWHLVKTQGKWKIVHLIYSAKLTPAQPVPPSLAK